MRAISKLVYHHSASPLTTSVEEIRKWHVGGNGWSDIGYNFIGLPDGVIRSCRPWRRQPAANGAGRNQGTVAIMFMGDNTNEHEQWTSEEVASARFFWRFAKLMWPGIEVCGHRDLQGTNTLCPGLDVRVLLGVVGG